MNRELKNMKIISKYNEKRKYNKNFNDSLDFHQIQIYIMSKKYLLKFSFHTNTLNAITLYIYVYMFIYVLKYLIIDIKMSMYFFKK
jgi:hypothetical protein